MDVKVYRKEAVRQPSGTEYVVSPNIIDIYPIVEKDENDIEVLRGAETLLSENEIIEQACLLATIWQKGLDPLATGEGIRWSEALLEEINVVQLMEDITNAVAEVTPTVEVVFSTVTDSNGNSFLKYTLKAVA
jgi:hypothetical protein